MRVQINTTNAAFTRVTNDEDNGTPDPGPEVARLLRQVADKIEGGATSDVIMDINGAYVGAWSL